MALTNSEDRPQGSDIHQFDKTLRQVLILPVLACVVLCATLIWQVRGATHTVRLIELSDQRIALTSQIEKLVVDEETGLRGYQITSDPRFLQTYHAASAPFASKLRQLQAIVRPEDANELETFIQEHQIWKQAFAEPTIAAIAAGGQSSDDDLNMTGRKRMDHMRSLLDNMIQGSVQNRGDRVSRWESQIHDLTFVLIFLSIAIGVSIGLFTRSRLEVISKSFGDLLIKEKNAHRSSLTPNRT